MIGVVYSIIKFCCSYYKISRYFSHHARPPEVESRLGPQLVAVGMFCSNRLSVSQSCDVIHPWHEVHFKYNHAAVWADPNIHRSVRVTNRGYRSLC